MMEASKSMCALCWDTISNELGLKFGNFADRDIPSFDCALFVSLKRTADDSLRGCIGTFESGRVSNQLVKYAKESAFDDSRFFKVRSEELKELSLCVTVLSNFVPISDCFDWNIGEHGVRIEYFDPLKKRKSSAVFLPSVMVEQGWDHGETISQLLRKGGYSGSLHDFDLRSISATKFQGHTVRMSYDEYSQIVGKDRML